VTDLVPLSTAEIINLDDPPEDAAVDAAVFVAEMRELAQANRHRAALGEQPLPILAGTMALYPREDGGIVAVIDGKTGPVLGPRWVNMPPGLVQAIALLANGGSKWQAIRQGFATRKALRGRG
jgi:hypothetical protein